MEKIRDAVFFFFFFYKNAFIVGAVVVSAVQLYRLFNALNEKSFNQDRNFEII